MVDFKQDRAIYLQMAERICDEILAGKYHSDDRIPSVREQAVMFEVNTNTVVKTYDLLLQWGIIYTRRGLGYFVTVDALNKHQGIRAALCWIPEIAHLARQHNNANVLVMPGRFIDEAMADKIMTEFFTTDFEGGRHQARIDKIPVR